MLPRAPRGWGRFGGAAADADSGSECDEEASPRAGTSVKLGPSLSVDAEEDEEVARELERVRRAAYEACLAEVVRHLDGFLARRPLASFEEWISDLHPDNLQVDRVTGESVLDQRFYAKSGEHRKLWNSRMPPVRQVQARSPEGSPASSMGGSSGARTPVLCRSAFSAPPLGYPYYELPGLSMGQPLQAAPPAFGASYLLPSLRLSGDPGADQLKAGAPPAHAPAAPQLQWGRAPPNLAIAATAPAGAERPVSAPALSPLAMLPPQASVQLQLPMGFQQPQQHQQQLLQGQQQQQLQQQQQYSPSCGQGQQPLSLHWQPPTLLAQPLPQRRSTVATASRTSASPLRTTGLRGRADSPLRTTGLRRCAESPLRTTGMQGRAESPLRTTGLSSGPESPLRTTGLQGRAGSPLRTAGLHQRAGSPLRTSGVQGRADSPLRTAGLPCRGSSAVVQPARCMPRAGASFVWPASGKGSSVVAVAAAGGG